MPIYVTGYQFNSPSGPSCIAHHYFWHCDLVSTEGGSGGAKVLGILSVPGRSTSLDNSRARAFCACNRRGWGLFGLFSLVCHFYSFLPFSGI